MVSDKEKAEWVMNSMDIRANDLFDRDFGSLIHKHKITVIIDMIEHRDFKGL